jgi:hypothetical protein
MTDEDAAKIDNYIDRKMISGKFARSVEYTYAFAVSCMRL